MKNELKKKLKFMPVKITDIETGGTEVGVPDLHIRTNHIDIWMESKKIDRMPLRKNSTITIKYRPGQYKWLKEYQKLGGVSVLAITYGHEWFMLTDIRKKYTVDELYELSQIPRNIDKIDAIDMLVLLNNLK